MSGSGLKIHWAQVRVGSSSVDGICVRKPFIGPITVRTAAFPSMRQQLCLQSAAPGAVCCMILMGAQSHFARVVKGVDLTSTGRKSAWVRAPQMTQRLQAPAIPARTVCLSLV